MSAQHTSAQVAEVVALAEAGQPYPEAAGAIGERDDLSTSAVLALMNEARTAIEAEARESFRAKADRGAFRHVSSMGRV